MCSTSVAIVPDYLVSLEVFILASVQLGALWGRRRAFLAGMTPFFNASALCWPALKFEQRVAFPFLHGAGSNRFTPHSGRAR